MDDARSNTNQKHKVFTFNILFKYAFHTTDSHKIISGDNLMSISVKKRREYFGFHL